MAKENLGQTWGLAKYRDNEDYKGGWLHHQLQMRGGDYKSTPKQIKDYADRKNMTVEGFRQYAVDECPICGSKLNYGRGDNKFKFEGRTPSLDNIDPSKGYNYGNTRIICNDCNHWKSTYTLEELLKKADEFPDNERLARLIKYIEEGKSSFEKYDEKLANDRLAEEEIINEFFLRVGDKFDYVVGMKCAWTQ